MRTEPIAPKREKEERERGRERERERERERDRKREQERERERERERDLVAEPTLREDRPASGRELVQESRVSGLGIWAFGVQGSAFEVTVLSSH